MLLLQDAVLELRGLFDDARREGVVLLVDSGVAQLLQSGVFARGPHPVPLVEVVAGVLAHEQLAHFGYLRLERALRVVFHLFLQRLAEELFGLVLGLVELVQHVPALWRVVHQLLLRDAFRVQLLEVQLASAGALFLVDLLGTDGPVLVAASGRRVRPRRCSRSSRSGSFLLSWLSVDPVDGAHAKYLLTNDCQNLYKHFRQYC